MNKWRNIRRHHWKERLKISKTARFESDTSEVSEDIAVQSCDNFQTLVWLEASVSLASLRSYIFVSF